jgi:actin-like ATPase involved in cell morphogenesis
VSGVAAGAESAYRLGIDFGTSTTVAMLSRAAGRTHPLLFDGSPLLSSAVLLGPEGTLHTGRDAAHLAGRYPERLEPNPKRRIDEGSVLLGDRAVDVVDLVAAVLRRVADEAHRAAGAPDEVVLTHPVGWGHHRRSALVAAAQRAGLGDPRLLAEPVAAATLYARLGTRPGPVLVYDLGAGTCDVTLLTPHLDGLTVTASAGLPDVGGLDVDAAIVAALQKRHGELWTDPAGRRRLWDEVRTAKEMLSRSSHTIVTLPALNSDVPLGRPEFEELAGPVLRRTVTLVTDLLRRAAVQPRDLAAVYLVGGSCRIPLVATLLHTALGVGPVVPEQPELVVAEGALVPEQVVRPAILPPLGPGLLLGPLGVGPLGPVLPGAPVGPGGPVLPGGPGAPVGPVLPGAPVSSDGWAVPDTADPAPISGSPVPVSPVSGSPMSASPVSASPVAGGSVSGGPVPGWPVPSGRPSAFAGAPPRPSQPVRTRPANRTAVAVAVIVAVFAAVVGGGLGIRSLLADTPGRGVGAADATTPAPTPTLSAGPSSTPTPTPSASTQLALYQFKNFGNLCEKVDETAIARVFEHREGAPNSDRSPGTDFGHASCITSRGHIDGSGLTDSIVTLTYTAWVHSDVDDARDSYRDDLDGVTINKDNPAPETGLGDQAFTSRIRPEGPLMEIEVTLEVQHRNLRFVARIGASRIAEGGWSQATRTNVENAFVASAKATYAKVTAAA